MKKKIRLKSFKFVTTLRYKGRIMKLFDIRKFMILVFVTIHEARVPSTIFRWFEGLSKVKILKKIDYSGKY